MLYVAPQKLVLVLKLVFFALIISCAFTPSVSCAMAAPAFKSYREWKATKIQEAEFKIKNLKEKMLVGAHRSFAADPNLLKDSKASESGLSEGLKTQLDREMMNLSLAQDISISDYFVGYLTKQPAPDQAIKEVSARLTPEEVAELMAAYAQHFFQTRPSSIKVAPRADSGL